MKPHTMQVDTLKILNKIARRAHLLINQQIYQANSSKDYNKGDPKTGGHCSASTSALHILGALHLVVKSGYDFIANKPHASPTDHAYNYLLELFLGKDLEKLSPKEAEQAMGSLRAFPRDKNHTTFQSYHSIYDPDHHNFLPSGTVGIPPVIAGYLALAYKATQIQGYKVPKAHFWSIIGDSEFREGSLMEAIPDLAEREVGACTWILDYNRQSLDGHRLVNNQIVGSDADRIEKTLEVNGWEVIQVRHGSFRKKLFEQEGGADFKDFLEKDLKDQEFQAFLLKSSEEIKKTLSKNSKLKSFLKNLQAKEVKQALLDLGGHDFPSLISALKASKKNTKRPCFIVAHTIKGWGLEMAGLSGNHSYLISQKELQSLRKKEEVVGESEFPLFSKNSKEWNFLQSRHKELYKEIKSQHLLKKENKAHFKKLFTTPFPQSLSVDFQKMSWPHTQWFLGQVASKFSRIANEEKPKKEEQALQVPGRLIYSMSPDVGTSTNLGFSMNEKVFGPSWLKEEKIKKDLEDKKSPNLVANESHQNRFIRFEITEANAISCMTAFGKIRDILGVPLLPLMTIYDFFIKRALDQYFYACYWQSSFILCGTPSGVTLSSEGAQHGWKSDFQIPNQITWEPFFIQELDWIFADALERHYTGSNEGREGVLIRAVTRGINQKELLNCLKAQSRFKQNTQILLSPKNLTLPIGKEESQEASLADEKILSQIREEVLKGAYYLLDYRGYADYIEEDNVVHIFSMGSPSTSAIEASQKLLNQGIYANVIVVTSPDLLLSNLATNNNYEHLKKGLNLADTKAPVVSVHDGEPGLLDNIGSILGCYQEALAVRKHSRCGRPSEIYKYHGIDSEAVVQACLQTLQLHSKKYFLLQNNKS